MVSCNVLGIVVWCPHHLRLSIKTIQTHLLMWRLKERLGNVSAPRIWTLQAPQRLEDSRLAEYIRGRYRIFLHPVLTTTGEWGFTVQTPFSWAPWEVFKGYHRFADDKSLAAHFLVWCPTGDNTHLYRSVGPNFNLNRQVHSEMFPKEDAACEQIKDE